MVCINTGNITLLYKHREILHETLQKQNNQKSQNCHPHILENEEWCQGWSNDGELKQRTVLWGNETDLGFEGKGTWGNNSSLHAVRSKTPDFKEEPNFKHDPSCSTEDRDFLWWFKSEKCSSLLNRKKKHVAQESLAGSMRPRKRKLSGKEPIPKKEKKRKKDIRNKECALNPLPTPPFSGVV